jgi:hypothetical protein
VGVDVEVEVLLRVAACPSLFLATTVRATRISPSLAT